MKPNVAPVLSNTSGCRDSLFSSIDVSAAFEDNGESTGVLVPDGRVPEWPKGTGCKPEIYQINIRKSFLINSL